MAYETFYDMVVEQISSSSYSSDNTLDNVAGALIGDDIEGTLASHNSNNGAFALYILQLARWLGKSGTNNYQPLSDFMRTVGAAIFQKYELYRPVADTWEKEIRLLRHCLSAGNSDLPNYLSYGFMMSLLKKYGLPYEAEEFPSVTTSWDGADLSQLEDFLVQRYLQDNETTDTTGNEKTDSTTSGTSKNASSSSGNNAYNGKSWDRSRPINYTTTDETTADSVEGAENTQTSSNISESDSTDTSTGNTEWNGTGNTTRDRVLKERRDSLIAMFKELAEIMTPLIPQLVDACAPAFIQEFAV